MFSKIGTPSTGVEKGLIVLALLCVGGVFAVRELNNVEVYQVFAAASPAAKLGCRTQTGSQSSRAYYDCIANSKDPDFLRAAGQYARASGMISIRPAP